MEKTLDGAKWIVCRIPVEGHIGDMLREAIEANLEVAEEVPGLQYWFFDKP